MNLLHQCLAEAMRRRASDLHLVVGLPPAIRVNGEIVLLDHDALDEQTTREMIYSLLSADQIQKFEQHCRLSVAVELPELGYFRVSVYYHRGRVEASIRIVGQEIRSLEELGLPPVVAELTRLSSGLILIAGPTGSGKTTTFNAMIHLINRDRRCRIITVEDPVEYIHRPYKSIIIQQEVGIDVPSFAEALYHMLRLDPDVIGIGEIRDQETIATALTAAETGHLVIGTIHTPDAASTVERIVSVFPPEHQHEIRYTLANALQAVIAQRLLPRLDGKGRVLAVEIMRVNEAIRNLIRENKIHQIDNVILTGQQWQMQSMDSVLMDLYQRGVIAYDVAVSMCKDRRRLEKRVKPGSY